MELNQAYLHKILHYDPETGNCKWKVRMNGSVYAGDFAGHLNITNNYYEIRIKGKSYQRGRIAWLYIEGYWPEFKIVHKNKDRSDDTWTNLKHLSPMCITRGRGMNRNNTSKIKGVCLNKEIGKWVAQIGVERKNVYLGLFKTKKEAAEARWEAEKKYKFPQCNSESTAETYLKNYESNDKLLRKLYNKE